tara:strand:+ start:2783 stop:3136 length:354 start_codon:yes stop_codon:yes gene_type:complete
MKKVVVASISMILATSACFASKPIDEINKQICHLLILDARLINNAQTSDVCKYLYRQHIVSNLESACGYIVKDSNRAKSILENVSFTLSVAPKKNNCEAIERSDNLRTIIDEFTDKL